MADSALQILETDDGSKSSLYLEMLTGCLDAGVLITDVDGKIVLCNASLAAIFGLTVEQVMGMGLGRFLEHVCTSAVNPPAVVRDRQLMPEAGRVVCEEFELKEPRSVIRWVTRSFTAPIRTQIVVCTDITTDVDLASTYQQLAVTDVLTGLSNRRGIDQHLRREASRAMRQKHELAFALLDVDFFKRVNDRWGHGVGDDVLRRVARAISVTLRASDIAARWGGEEFLVMLVDTGLAGARLCAERIRVAIEGMNIPRVGRVTLSAGVSELAVGEDLSLALLRADQFLYKAKGDGRNCVRG
jgi:diguanylate cyclase (GGDEF)-like protein